MRDRQIGIEVAAKDIPASHGDVSLLSVESAVREPSPDPSVELVSSTSERTRLDFPRFVVD